MIGFFFRSVYLAMDNWSNKIYAQNVNEWKNNLSKKRFSDDTLKVQTVENGIILPARNKGGFKGGVCDSNLNFIAGFTRGGSTNGFAVVSDSYSVEPKDIIHVDDDVIYGGSLIGHFGHFMAECFCRLWYVVEHPELQSKIVFITTTHGGWHPWFDDFFELMGIARERLIYVKKPLQFRSITVPDQSQYSPRTFTKEFLIPYQSIKQRVTPSAPQKLYLTRTQFEADDNIGVHCFNEKYFEDYFVSKGFKAVSMEKLPLAEQIALIMGADEVVSTVGTLTHWALFCKPTAKFIMLNRTDHTALALQCLINEATGIDYYIVDISKNFMYANWNVGVCMLGSNRHWKQFVENYFGDRIEEDDDNLYFDKALDDYINFWCQKYSQPQHLQRRIDSLKSMCNRIISLEKQLNVSRPILRYQTHLAKLAWLPWKIENQLSGTLEQKLDIQAIRIDFSEPFHDVFYSVYYPEGGWTEEVSTGQMAGTIYRSKPIIGIKIRLDEEGAKKFDILYRLHDFNGNWSDWTMNGAGIRSDNVRFNAIQIKLHQK